MLFSPEELTAPDFQRENLLSRLIVLALDCQASGPPGNGRLLEVAWAPVQAFKGWDHPEIEAHLIKRSRSASLPSRVKRITGPLGRQERALRQRPRP